MKGFPEERVLDFAEYMIANHATVRQTAKQFGVSKSTVHKNLTVQLKQQNPILFLQVQEVMQVNKQERHLRGGLATKKKYEMKKETVYHRA